MTRERLNQILAERRDRHPIYANHGWRYFDEAIPVLEEYLSKKEVKVEVKVEPEVIVKKVLKKK